jgi:hypothetical protein
MALGIADLEFRAASLTHSTIFQQGARDNGGPFL